MTLNQGDLRICEKGHQYYKRSDCPSCPECEAERKPQDGFLSPLSAPARRALEREGITTLEKLSRFKTADILRLHGVGPSTIPKLKAALAEKGRSFKE